MPAPRDAFEFRMATPADEADIRRLVGATPMPGAIAVRFEREPNYFLGCDIMGDVCDVILARHGASGDLAGVLCRTERRAFVNGEEAVIGGIGQIRVASGYRGNWLLQRGWPLFRNRDLLYAGVVARDNPRARGVLAGRRPPGGPEVAPLAGLTTFGLILRAGMRPRPVPRGWSVEWGSPDQLEDIVTFLRSCGRRRQLFPAYRVADFTGGRLLRGLAVEDVAVVRRGTDVAGVMAMWDQTAFRQDIVHAYGPRLRRLMPLYGAATRLVGAQPLPRPGEMIRTAWAAMVCVANDDPQVFRLLLSTVARRAHRSGMAYLLVGFADQDPLLPLMRRSLHLTYRADLFVGRWGGGGPLTGLDQRTPYVEVATL